MSPRPGPVRERPILGPILGPGWGRFGSSWNRPFRALLNRHEVLWGNGPNTWLFGTRSGPIFGPFPNTGYTPVYSRIYGCSTVYSARTACTAVLAAYTAIHGCTQLYTGLYSLYTHTPLYTAARRCSTVLHSGPTAVLLHYGKYRGMTCI